MYLENEKSCGCEEKKEKKCHDWDNEIVEINVFTKCGKCGKEYGEKRGNSCVTVNIFADCEDCKKKSY